jgi:peptidoglycan/xylan/chitin deacetylase (PgdA/CDA1 family)
MHCRHCRTSALIAALVTWSAAVGAEAEGMAERAPQYVLISFDGAHENRQWARSLALAKETGARFTYFLSCTFLLSSETRSAYVPPKSAPRASNVGFGSSREDVETRLNHIWQAHAGGHEIASHGCGHFDGSNWSKEEWRHELSEFSRILADAWQINGIAGEPSGWRILADERMDGFRAPYLATGPGLKPALKSLGYAYDASAVSKGPAFPARDGSLVRFALPLIPEGPHGRPVIAMDYNLFVRHSGGRETEDLEGRFEERTFEAFRAAFVRQDEGERIPLQIGYHFTLMNGGVYWSALERFVREVCPRPDVRCTSYRAYLDEMAAGADG